VSAKLPTPPPEGARKPAPPVVLMEGLRTAADIAAVEILRLQDGDVVVLRARGKLSRDQIQRLSEIVTPLFPENVRVMVLDDDISISVVRPPQES